MENARTVPRDEVLFNILADSGNFIQFFESIFGFLYRRTDFYKEHTTPDEHTIGLSPGVAENLVLKIFHKYQNLKKEQAILERLKRLGSDGVAPAAVEELEVSTEESSLQELVESEETVETSDPDKASEAKDLPCAKPSKSIMADDFNGASYEHYSWSQAIGEVDVEVKVPEHVTRGKQVVVDISAQGLRVALAGSSESLLEGKFPHKTRKNEAFWSLVPGRTVQVHLEKCDQRWWERLITSEPQIDLQRISVLHPSEELSEMDHMKVEEIVYGRRQEIKDSATGNKEPMQHAWNESDAPFDPSVVTLDLGTTM